MADRNRLASSWMGGLPRQMVVLLLAVSTGAACSGAAAPATVLDVIVEGQGLSPAPTALELTLGRGDEEETHWFELRDAALPGVLTAQLPLDLEGTLELRVVGRAGSETVGEATGRVMVVPGERHSVRLTLEPVPEPVPRLAIESVCPRRIEPGGRFEVHGTGFDDRVSLTLDAAEGPEDERASLTAAIEDDRLVSQLPDAFSAQAGPITVQVTRSDGAAATQSDALRFDELEDLDLSTSQRGNHTDLTITGRGFDEDMVVLVDGESANVTSVEATRIVARLPDDIGYWSDAEVVVCYPGEDCDTFSAPRICRTAGTL